MIRCDNCVYFVEFAVAGRNGDGTCRGVMPVLDGNGVATWPMVKVGDGCGRGDEKPVMETMYVEVGRRKDMRK